MQLSQLTGKKGLKPLDIKGLTLDSRKVEPGYLFAALKGEKTAGVNFIPDALKKGAVAVLTDADEKVEIKGAVHLSEPNARQAFAKMVAAFYGAQPKILAAVTGTNGKTSVAHFVRQLWQYMGAKAGSIGTIGVVAEGVNYASGLTTPEPCVLHKALKGMADHGVTHAIIEASSHGISQYRVDGAHISIAAFTNLTQDHMDYHADEENYFHAKARLFEEILNTKGTAVLNIDSPFGARINEAMKKRGIKTITVGRQPADVTIKQNNAERGGQRISFSYRDKDYSTFFPVIGTFQADNVIMACAIVIASGFDAEKVFRHIYYLAGVPGRMEKVGEAPNGGEIYIDYAHTPDGMTNALNSIKLHTYGKLHIVFGCGGNRDTGKRPKMGAIAETLADFVYITDDNPRHEDPMEIRQQIMEGCPTGIEFVDRADAIRYGVRKLQPNDVLIITGKGNETGQIIGDKVLPFSDKEVVRETIAKMMEEAA